ncbi:MAG: hypothetical protein AAF547_21620 [Actinomycetota bacterium]
MHPRPGAGADLVAFATPILINMANRPDRLRDSLDELRRVTGRAIEPGRELHLLRPERFDDAGGFANPGFRSNLDAHLRAARWAAATGQERVLILEDDVGFRPDWVRHGPALLAELADRPWHLASLGYLDTWGEAPTGPNGWVRFGGKVNGAHAYLLHRSAHEAWIAHLEAIAVGTPGDDLQGPMPSDGALNTFAWLDPDHIRLLAVPNQAGTRPTRSDITPGLVDRLPIVADVVERLRQLRRRRGTSVVNYR